MQLFQTGVVSQVEDVINPIFVNEVRTVKNAGKLRF